MSPVVRHLKRRFPHLIWNDAGFLFSVGVQMIRTARLTSGTPCLELWPRSTSSTTSPHTPIRSAKSPSVPYETNDHHRLGFFPKATHDLLLLILGQYQKSLLANYKYLFRKSALKCKILHDPKLKKETDKKKPDGVLSFRLIFFKIKKWQSGILTLHLPQTV